MIWLHDSIDEILFAINRYLAINISAWEILLEIKLWNRKNSLFNHTSYSADQGMEEVWKRVEEYEILYSIQFENLIIDVLKANQLNVQIKPNKFAS